MLLSVYGLNAYGFIVIFVVLSFFSNDGNIRASALKLSAYDASLLQRFVSSRQFTADAVLRDINLRGGIGEVIQFLESIKTITDSSQLPPEKRVDIEKSFTTILSQKSKESKAMLGARLVVDERYILASSGGSSGISVSSLSALKGRSSIIEVVRLTKDYPLCIAKKCNDITRFQREMNNYKVRYHSILSL